MCIITGKTILTEHIAIHIAGCDLIPVALRRCNLCHIALIHLADNVRICTCGCSHIQELIHICHQAILPLRICDLCLLICGSNYGCLRTYDIGSRIRTCFHRTDCLDNTGGTIAAHSVCRFFGLTKYGSRTHRRHCQSNHCSLRNALLPMIIHINNSSIFM